MVGSKSKSELFHHLDYFLIFVKLGSLMIMNHDFLQLVLIKKKLHHNDQFQKYTLDTQGTLGHN